MKSHPNNNSIHNADSSQTGIQERLSILLSRRKSRLARSIGKRYHKVNKSVRKRCTKLSKSLKKRLDRLALSLGKKKIKVKNIYLMDQRKNDVLAALDQSRETILIVSHEASRTGTPILSLNIAQQLSQKYNVIAVLLGGGGLLNQFHEDCSFTINLFPGGEGSEYGWSLLEKILPPVNLKFAIVNSIVSIHILPILNRHKVPTLCLVHEFASYTPPRTAICEVERMASKVIFSADVVYKNNAEQCKALSEEYGSVILPQGKCVIPSSDDVEPDLIEANQIRQMLRPASCPDDTVVILGAGSVNIRKGVDLFLMCVARVVELKPKNPFRFVWVGGGFNPEKDFGYSVYLQDQMERAELENHVVFTGEVSNIELVYELSDLLLLSSRLDPLPNVAIDSLLKSIPVLCFDRTTGIADILKQGGLGESCVMPYLDTERVAQQIVKLIDNAELRNQLGHASGELAEKRFDMGFYVDELERHALGCVSEKQIEESEIMNLEFFSPPAAPTMTYQQAARRFVRSWNGDAATRRPLPGFHPGIYEDTNKISGSEENPLAAFINAGKPTGPWLSDLIEPENTPSLGKTDPLRAALHIHVESVQLFLDVFQRLEDQDVQLDLLVSVPSSQVADAVSARTHDYHRGSVTIKCDGNPRCNMRSLVGEFGQRIHQSYEVIGHVHAGAGRNSEALVGGSVAVDFAHENLLGGKHPMASTILAKMVADDHLGLVYPNDPYISTWKSHQSSMEAIARLMNVDCLPGQYFDYPVDSMFWARTDAIKPILLQSFPWDDLPVESVQDGIALSQALVRLMPTVVQRMKYNVAMTYVSSARK